MKLLFPFLGIVILCLACTGEARKKHSYISQEILRRQYMETNKFLDVDMTKFLPDAQTGIVPAVTSEDSAQMSVALYRFYSHVRLVDDAYECDLKSGKEIHLSENTFQSLSENLQQLNLHIKRVKEKGGKIIIPEVTPEYLNALLTGKKNRK